jgi:RNA polymerase sigma factor (sigma-70 family)
MPNHRQETQNAERGTGNCDGRPETRSGNDGDSALRAPRSAFRSGLPDVEELIPTRDSLLSRLKDWRDDDSWRDFFNTYWKLVYGVALKSGLTEQEAEEVVQETVITVARRIPEFKYDPSICSFKTWLLNLTRWRIIDQLRKRQPTRNAERETRNTNTAAIERLPNPPDVDLDAMWDTEWQRSLVSTAIQRVKRRVNPEHYQIFHLCVFKEWPVKKVARELEVNVAQVYLAKHRVGALLKKEVKALEKKLNEQ